MCTIYVDVQVSGQLETWLHCRTLHASQYTLANTYWESCTYRTLKIQAGGPFETYVPIYNSTASQRKRHSIFVVPQRHSALPVWLCHRQHHNAHVAIFNCPCFYGHILNVRQYEQKTFFVFLHTSRDVRVMSVTITWLTPLKYLAMHWLTWLTVLKYLELHWLTWLTVLKYLELHWLRHDSLHLNIWHCTDMTHCT